jgi:uncharacterized phage protein (TIGR01671 family)
MSREIKFRVFDKNENDFVKWELLNDGIIDLYHLFFAKDENLIIQQFTGLKDVNGKEIYEGDIIKCKPLDVIHPQDLFKYNNFEFLTSSVYWSKEYCCFETDFNSSCFVDSENVIEVIGNIYENPELLQS